MRTTPQRHNVVAVLTEAASVKMASPIFLDKSQLAGQTRGFTNHEPAVNFVDPWPGGWWRLRDIIDYELIAARSILTLAAKNRQQFQTNYSRMAREAIQLGRAEPPYGWVVPIDQPDPGTAAKMVGILHDTGIRVFKAKSPFTVNGASYPAGSWVLPTAQPYRAHLKDMMERQHYPNRLGPNGQAEPPYDVAGWTLPLQMGVKAVALEAHDQGQGEFEEIDRVEPPKAIVRENLGVFVLNETTNDDHRLINDLLQAGVKVHPYTVRQFLVQATPEARAVLDRTLPLISSRVESIPGEVGGYTSSQPLKKPSIALYQPWIPSMDEGWTRFVLEAFDFPYTTVHDAELRSGDLGARFRTIVLPSIPTRTLREGYRPDETEPAYVGGLGAEGSEALRKFVEGGGTLVCLENSSLFAIELFGLPVKEVLRELKTSEFYAPGSILRCDLVENHPLTVGLPREVSAYFARSLAFEADKDKANVVATYAKRDPLESGWLLGPDKIQGKAAIVQVPVGRGQVVLFGFPPQHRGQTHGTFRLLFNALRFGTPG